jgi:hypothetical protein
MDTPEDVAYKMDKLRDSIIKAIENHPWILDEDLEYSKVAYKAHVYNQKHEKQIIIDSQHLSMSFCRAALFEARREYKRRHKL